MKRPAGGCLELSQPRGWTQGTPSLQKTCKRCANVMPRPRRLTRACRLRGSPNDGAKRVAATSVPTKKGRPLFRADGPGADDSGFQLPSAYSAGRRSRQRPGTLRVSRSCCAASRSFRPCPAAFPGIQDGPCWRCGPSGGGGDRLGEVVIRSFRGRREQQGVHRALRGAGGARAEQQAPQRAEAGPEERYVHGDERQGGDVRVAMVRMVGFLSLGLGFLLAPLPVCGLAFATGAAWVSGPVSCQRAVFGQAQCCSLT